MDYAWLYLRMMDLPPLEATSIAKKIFLSNVGLLADPYKLNFAVTYRCNSRCRICNIWCKEPEGELTLDEIQKIFENSNFFSWISLTGGEPFLRQDIADIARILKEKCSSLYILNIPTNGFLTETILEKMNDVLSLGIPKCVVTVSLDGPEEVHEYIRGILGVWKRSVETYKRLKSLSGKGLDVFFEFTVCPYNTGKFMETYLAVKKEIPSISVNDFHVNVFHHSGHFYSNLHLEDTTSFRENLGNEINQIIAIKKRRSVNPMVFLPQTYLKLAERYAKTRRTPLECRVLSSSCFIDPKGNVFPCTIFSKNLGNLRNFGYDLKRILELDETKETKRVIKELKCPNCWTPCEAYPMILGNMVKCI